MDDLTIRTSLQMLTPEVWSGVAELPRLRIENKLVSGIRQGEVSATGRSNQALATWSNNFLRAFTNRSDAANALISSLDAQDPDARHYVAKFFMRSLPEGMPTPAHVTRCIRAIVSGIEADDANIRLYLISAVLSYPAEWQEKLAEALKGKSDEENPAVYLNDGTPFLSAPTKDELDDDIPF